jgi:ribosomal protein L1
MKTTAYFDAVRQRTDRRFIQELWIERDIQAPLRETRQADGRIRRWVCIPEMENRYLRVILLADGQTVHNAFFDRRFVP